MDRQSSFFILTATLSNIGRFDSFVGSKGKVGIGQSGHPPAIDFIVEEHQESPIESEATSYIAIESRRPKSIKFIARLSEDKRNNVKSAFESGLVYLRLGLLVSVGQGERQILSPSTPFSVEAHKQYKTKVGNIAMTI